MSKKIYYEDRDKIQLKLLEVLQAELKSFGTRLTAEDEDRFSDLTDNLLEPYTEGVWRNFN